MLRENNRNFVKEFHSIAIFGNDFCATFYLSPIKRQILNFKDLSSSIKMI